MERSRIVRIRDKIIITNYKCMFSSLNKLKICELNPCDNKKYEKIMLYRNPYDRIISCFLNWMIRIPDTRNIINFNEQEIRDMCNNDMFGWLISLLIKGPDFDLNNYLILLKEKNIIELFKIYINLLPKIKDKDPHMQSQIKILKKQNFNIIDLFINIDKKYDIIILEEKIKQNIPKSNSSIDVDKDLCMNFLNNNTNYKKKLYDLYKDDFDYLPIE